MNASIGPALPAAPTAAGSAPKVPDSVRKAAEDFEASFISALMQPLFEGLSTNAPFGGGDGEAAFKSLLVDAFARQAARSGGVGLSSRITSELIRMQASAS